MNQGGKHRTPLAPDTLGILEIKIDCRTEQKKKKKKGLHLL